MEDLIEQIKIEKAICFFRDYQTFQSLCSKQQWSATESSYKKLLDTFTLVRSEAVVLEKTTASQFNIFSILKLNFSEVKLHTPILANLLDPCGTHSQGNLFYTQFIQICFPAPQHNQLLSVGAFDLEIAYETRNFAGQIDILIISHQVGNRFAIIIENKVEAPDQPKQLFRYYFYASQALGLKPDQIKIVYLTKTGQTPEFDSYSENEKQIVCNVLTNISFKTHIIEFLQNSFCKVSSNKIQNIISQYIESIKYILES